MESIQRILILFLSLCKPECFIELLVGSERMCSWARAHSNFSQEKITTFRTFRMHFRLALMCVYVPWIEDFNRISIIISAIHNLTNAADGLKVRIKTSHIRPFSYSYMRWFHNLCSSLCTIFCHVIHFEFKCKSRICTLMLSSFCNAHTHTQTSAWTLLTVCCCRCR